jgi:pimeloyl-ACP methyl ester carboxylesterase
VRHFLKRHIYFDPSLVTDEWVDYLWERVNRPGGFAAAAAALRFCARPDVIARSARAVRAPSLVVWGEEDRLFPPASARRLGDDLRAADVILIPRCGHAPQEERPDELLRAIARFLGLPRVEMRAVS